MIRHNLGHSAVHMQILTLLCIRSSNSFARYIQCHNGVETFSEGASLFYFVPT